MPELPEVETLARKLHAAVAGRRIIGVGLSGKSLRKPVDASLAARLQGRVIRKITRRGKYLVAELEPKGFLLLHLGMSGRIFCGPRAAAADKHTHAVIRFSDGGALVYRDPRRFGLLAAYEVTELDQIPEIRCLGMDPFDAGFTGRWLAALLCESGRDIKSFLLDQSKIAGLGNIYACEALFLSGIHPARRCRTVSPQETVRLVRAVRRVLRLAIRNHGTSFSDFMDAEGKPGNNQHYLKVFLREGRMCIRCRTRIRRMRQGNRSSFFCPRCQR